MLLYSPTLAAQEKKTTIEEEKVPFYQGTTIGVDIFGLGSKIFGGDITSTEISVEVNLKNRYVPVAEIGYGTTDTTDDGTNIHYKASLFPHRHELQLLFQEALSAWFSIWRHTLRIHLFFIRCRCSDNEGSYMGIS